MMQWLSSRLAYSVILARWHPWAVVVGIGCCSVLWSPLPTLATPLTARSSVNAVILRPGEPEQQRVDEALAVLSQADVVYLGETHTHPADHVAKLQIIQSLYRLRPTWVIGLEAFQHPDQELLDQYVVGQRTEAQLRIDSQYEQRWGYAWDFYAPVLRFAKTHQLAVVALNVPTEITRKVARQGLESLTTAEWQLIPSRAALQFGPKRYRQRLQRLYDEMHQGKGNSQNFERFFTAQVLWDETMAEQIVKAMQRYPAAQIVVVVGQGHLLFGDGIPARVERRVKAMRRPLRQVSVLLNPEPAWLNNEATPAIADYFWYSSP